MGLSVESMEGSPDVSAPPEASPRHLLAPRMGTTSCPLFARLADVGGEGKASVGRSGAGHWWEETWTGIRDREGRFEHGDKVSG